jgi:hypothetical protein
MKIANIFNNSICFHGNYTVVEAITLDQAVIWALAWPSQIPIKIAEFLTAYPRNWTTAVSTASTERRSVDDEWTWIVQKSMLSTMHVRIGFVRYLGINGKNSKYKFMCRCGDIPTVRMPPTAVLWAAARNRSRDLQCWQCTMFKSQKNRVHATANFFYLLQIYVKKNNVCSLVQMW